MAEYPATVTQALTAIQTAADYLLERIPRCSIAIILGSGLGQFSNRIENPTIIPYSDIPNMPTTSVIGHSGKVYSGTVEGVPVICWGGRFHRYEGYEGYQTTWLAHLSALLGAKVMLVTNASGGGITGMIPGCVLFIRNHINGVGENPFKDNFHTLFTQQPVKVQYSNDLIDLAKEVALRRGQLPVYDGCYCWNPGPCFETPYEVRCQGKLGGDCFGMSTVPELLACSAYGIQTIPMSVITNLAAGTTGAELTHSEVQETVNNVQAHVEGLVIDIIKELHQRGLGLLDEPNYDIRGKLPVPVRSLERTLHHGDIENAVALIERVVLQRGKPEHAMFLGIRQAKCLRQITLQELPGFPIRSASGFDGVIGIENIGTTTFLIISTDHLQGFDTVEAAYLSFLLSNLGVKHVIGVVKAEPLSETGANVSLAEDYFSCVNQSAYQTPEASAVRVQALGTAKVAVWGGPTLPSEAEYEYTRRLGFSHITVTNLNILSEVGNRGIAHSLLLVNQSLEDPTSTPSELFYDISEVVPRLHLQSNKSEVHPNSSDKTPLPSTEQEIDELANRISNAHPNLSVTLIVSNETYRQLENILPDVKETLTYPNSNTRLLITDTHFIIAGIPYATHNAPALRTYSLVRVSNALGIRNVVVIDEVIGADVELGTWVSLKDHNMMFGDQGLRGENILHWGTRFPDVSRLYNAQVRQLAIDQFAAQGLQLREVYATYTNTERAVFGPAHKQMCNVLESSVLTTKGVSAAVVSQHRAEGAEPRKVLYLGFVAKNFESDEKLTPDLAGLETAVGVINQLVSTQLRIGQ